MIEPVPGHHPGYDLIIPFRRLILYYLKYLVFSRALTVEVLPCIISKIQIHVSYFFRFLFHS